MRDDAKELSAELDLEFWFDQQSIPFRVTRGSSGMQLNLQSCPACGDKRWRTYLNQETGIGNCFVCNQGFNKLSFIHAYLGGSWRDTFTHVREALVDQGWRPKRMTPTAVEMGDVELPVSFPLPTAAGENLVYLQEREISPELARYFALRFCASGRWWFDREDGGRGYQQFDNRVIIPVFDLDGKLMTFQGRDVTGESDTKYLFPKMLPGTGRYLYNGHNAVGKKRAVLLEGFFDVAATKRALDEDVALRGVVPLGSFGKHLSYGSLDGNDQLGRFLELKRNGLLEVTIMWDGEPRALSAALQAAETLRKVGLIAKIALLPPDRDPNEVLPEVVREAFYKAEPYTSQLAVKWRLRNPYSCR